MLRDNYGVTTTQWSQMPKRNDDTDDDFSVVAWCYNDQNTGLTIKRL